MIEISKPLPENRKMFSKEYLNKISKTNYDEAFLNG